MNIEFTNFSASLEENKVSTVDMYLNARTYSEKLNSHLLKNSEWGAVVYLTHSQYGRNGSEIDVNDNSNHITADEGIEKNLEQSSTGNIYGVYDLSGGTHEYTSTYYNSGSENLIEYGKSFIDLSNEDKKTTILSKIDEIDIQEQYSHATQETELIISLTTTDEIMIDCNDEYVTIPKDQIEFLIDTLGKLVK